MARQIEIEYKTLLSSEDYQKVFDYYELTDKPYTEQTNIYFDTTEKALRNRRFGLRIRRFKEEGELTLKCPTKTKGLLEITDVLSFTQMTDCLAKQTILTTGEVAKHLQAEGIALDELAPIAELTTKRYEWRLPIGLLALDHSWYHGTEDFELELEVDEEVQGEKDFYQLLEQLAIPFQAAENKIVRALKVK